MKTQHLLQTRVIITSRFAEIMVFASSRERPSSRMKCEATTKANRLWPA
ncbi:MAG: hypothetical protein AAF514_06020 [Verrucomicrobiota bacterium]